MQGPDQAAVVSGMKISTVLRMWCKTCQAATLSEDCPQCAAPGMACASCHECVIHGNRYFDLEDI